MKRLQELILDLGVLSLDEINQAIFSYPEFGLVESISRQYGESVEEKVLQHLSRELGVRLLESKDFEVEEALLLENAIEIAPLIEELRAFPVRLIEENQSVMLAMANPLDSRAREAFRRVLKRPIETYLARERDIQLATASVAGKLGLKAREESRGMTETSLSSLTRYVEDPEVRKAIQQLTATAVKHRVSAIRVDLTKAYVDAKFSFDDDRSSSVEISVNPVAMLTALLRKGQVSRHADTIVHSETRVNFKSSSVDISLKVDFEVRDEATVRVPQQMELSDFRVDALDNPLFWHGIEASHAEAIREVFEARNGIFVVASSDDRARQLALRALKQSFNDVHCSDIRESIDDSHSLLRTAKESRVLLGLHSESALSVISQLQSLSVENRELFRGILSFYAAPAICPCCSSRRALSSKEQASLPPWAVIPNSEIAFGHGCAVCLERGTLGVLGISSVLDMGSRAGKRFIEGAKNREIALGLASDAFESVSENGIHRIAAGKSSFTETLQTIPEMAEELLYAAEERRNGNLPEEEVEEESEQIDLTLAPDEEFPAASESRLITGRGVFASGTRPAVQVPDSGEDFTLRDEDESIASVVDETKAKQVSAPEKKEEVPAVAEDNTVVEEALTLLVIDDDPDQRSILRKVFELEGYKVETAADGVDGIVSANRVQPTVIIVDFMMPELDGRETIQRLKADARTSEIPIVALTAYADPDVEYGLLKAGADDFCAKSVSKKVLLRRVERLVPDERPNVS